MISSLSFIATVAEILNEVSLSRQMSCGRCGDLTPIYLSYDSRMSHHLYELIERHLA